MRNLTIISKLELNFFQKSILNFLSFSLLLLFLNIDFIFSDELQSIKIAADSSGMSVKEKIEDVSNEEKMSDNDKISDVIIEEEYYRNGRIDWGKLFEIFLHNQNKLVNRTMLSVSTGVTVNDLPSKLNLSLPHTQLFNIEYGFVRIDSAFGFDRLRSYSSEFAFIEDNTNVFGLFKRDAEALYVNLFSFGAGLRSGYGTKLSETSDLELYLLHSTAFTWTTFDYSNDPPNSFFDSYNKNYKFGTKGIASLSCKITKRLYLDLGYEHNNIYSGMEYGKWFGSWFIDLFLQRWIDILDPIFVQNFGYAYPFIRFFYKNSISIISSEIRNLQQFYPFASDYSLLERRFVLKFKFIF